MAGDGVSRQAVAAASGTRPRIRSAARSAIIIVGPLSDLVGTTVVILAVATSILIAGIASVVVRGPLRPEESVTVADPHAVDPIAAALGADRRGRTGDGG